jgi:hypothetical protein
MSTTVLIAKCGEKVIASTYVRHCVSEVLLELLNRFCQVAPLELPTECVVSGIKVTGGSYNYMPRDCTYVEISQGFYVLQPGAIDAQCFYCDGDISCRFSLQRRICSSKGYDKVGNHIDLETIRKLVERIVSLPGNFMWCVNQENRLFTYEI